MITAITLLAAGIVLAYRHSDTFKAALQSLWGWFKTIAGYTPLGLQIRATAAVFQWAVDHGLGPFRSALDAVWSAIQRVTDAIQALIGWISKIKWPTVPKFLSKIPGSPFSAGYGLPAAASSVSPTRRALAARRALELERGRRRRS